jgi:death-on-curing protein
MGPIDIDDYLAIAAEVLGLDGQTIARVANIPLAESALHAPFASFGGEDFYPEPIEKAGVLCSRLVRNHPLPDGNKRTAYLAMLIFLEINGITWQPPGETERVLAVEALAASTMTEAEFTNWLREHTS